MAQILLRNVSRTGISLAGSVLAGVWVGVSFDPLVATGLSLRPVGKDAVPHCPSYGKVTPKAYGVGKPPLMSRRNRTEPW